MAAKQARRFVVVSGLPGSGKTSLARRLSPLLNLPVIDKDDILEDLFAARGMGDVAWRRELSRESDLLFRAAAEDSSGGILVSFWHLTGMPLDSGTPTNWLASLSSQIVHLHCECPPAIAAERYSQRRRHSGHLDHLKSRDEILQTIERVADCEPFQIGTRVNCDTSSEVDFTLLMARISEAFRKP